MHGGHFRRTRLIPHAAVAAVEADPIIGGDILYAVVVYVLHLIRVHVVDGAVVVEVIAVPVAALVPIADITEAIVDTAVVADVPAPVAMVESVVVA
jgi:hypothetical protein